MKKLVILVLVAIFSSTSIYGQEQKFMNIVMKDGSCISYELTSRLVYIGIRFNDSYMTVNNVDFNIGDVEKYYVSNEDNSITAVESGNKIEQKIYGNKLYIVTPQKGIIKLYDISGNCVITKQLDDQKSVIDLTALEKGTYIVWINKDSFKFRIR